MRRYLGLPDVASKKQRTCPMSISNNGGVNVEIPTTLAQALNLNSSCKEFSLISSFIVFQIKEETINKDQQNSTSSRVKEKKQRKQHEKTNKMNLKYKDKGGEENPIQN